MRKIRLLLEYGTNNVFLYDEEGCVIAGDLPEEARSDEELVSLMNDIREKYKAACEDDTGRFEYWTGALHVEKLGGLDPFKEELKQFAKLVKDRLGDRYEIVDEFPEFYGEEK